jgi:hypothetical protein
MDVNTAINMAEIRVDTMKAAVLIFALSYYTFCPAQGESETDSSACHTHIRLSYVSSLIYPGISAGVEFQIKHSDYEASGKAEAAKRFKKKRLISGSLNWYHHPWFHDNLYLTAEWVMRRTRNDGFISEFSAGPGYSRTFLGGTTYKVDDDGNVSVVRCAGYNYALITIGGGFGYDFAIKKNMPFSAIGKLNIISMFPYNSTVYFRPVLDIGIRYTPEWCKSKVSRASLKTSEQK